MTAPAAPRARFAPFRAVVAAALLALSAACAAAPDPSGPPPRETARSAADQRVGDQSHPQILAQYGGAYDGPVADYVARLGMRLAALTDQPDAPWTFTVLDSPVVNAFALPGGYVYVTRGLLALAGDEAQVAGVVGHEIGHVTAAHSAQRRQRAGLAGFGVLAAQIGAAVLGADGQAVRAIGELASVGAQGAVASYSRGQELEADRLGVEYLARAAYDPRAQADFLRAMQAQSALTAQLAGQGYDPTRVDFLATHPATAQRVQLAEAAAAAMPPTALRRERDAFLAALDGMTYGDSAAQGFVRGRRFLHPQQRFSFEAGEGFEIANAARAITLRGPRGAGLRFDGPPDPGGPLDAVTARWAATLAGRGQAGPVTLTDVTRIGGMEAAQGRLPVSTRQGPAVATLTAVRHPSGALYRFFGLAGRGDDAALAAMERTAVSFRALSAAQARAARPWRIQVRTVRAGDTVASLAARTPFAQARQARFRVLNGLAPGQEPRPGDRVKLVVE